jgi:serine/threonine protein kinase
MLAEWTIALGRVRSGEPKIGPDDFDWIRLIGRGHFGAVHLARHRLSGRLFAIKTMSKQTIPDYQQIEQTLTERSLLLQITHPFLVSAHLTFQAETSVFLVLDYIPGGELFSRLKAEHTFRESRARLYSAEILLALGHLHSLGFVYRDLKPENILIDDRGHIRLTDFGLAKSLGLGNETTSTFCGTPEYLPPEMLRQQPYSKTVDWWELGCIIYEMFAGLPPFSDENQNHMNYAIQHDEVSFDSEIPETVRDLVARLLEKDPRKRLGSGNDDFVEIQSHPFFAELDWDAVMKKEIDPEWRPQLTTDSDVSNFDRVYTAQNVGVAGKQTKVDALTQSAFVGFTCVNASRL